MIIGKDSSDYKNKKPVVYDTDYLKQVKDHSTEDLTVSCANDILELDAVEEGQNIAEPDTGDSNSDIYDDYYEEDDDDYEYDDDAINVDCSYSLAAKFDDLDLPPGVEATVPWLEKAPPVRPKSDKNIILEGDIDVKYRAFKQFDTVDDYSDHFYAKDDKETKKPPKDWMKKIQRDWKLLEHDLPESIFVRVYEERMDLLRAVIVGPAGTPYHDGLFFFDFQFPINYPSVPPRAHYHSGGLRLNPNLYACGKVCLSLLGTWHGKGCEKWDNNKSTMLQVLVSIQALVLNEKPYFNEPGYEESANTNQGENQALVYNETAFLYSCKTMMYSLRNPPKCFEDFVAGHFRKYGHDILVACRAYLDSAQVGSTIVENKGQNAGGSSKGCSPLFKGQLRQLFEDLLMEFTVKGADCKEFLNQKVKAGDATALPVTEDAAQ